MQTLRLLGGLPFRINSWDNFQFPADLVRVGISDVAKKEGMQTAGWNALTASREGASGEVAGFVCSKCKECRKLKPLAAGLTSISWKH